MTTTARTVAEATVWTINEDGLSTNAAIALCARRAEDVDVEGRITVYRMEDGSAVRFDEFSEDFSHDLEF